MRSDEGFLYSPRGTKFVMPAALPVGPLPRFLVARFSGAG